MWNAWLPSMRKKHNGCYLPNLSPRLSSACPPYKQADSHLHTLDLSMWCPITSPPPAAAAAPVALNVLKDFILLRAACLILSLVTCPSWSTVIKVRIHYRQIFAHFHITPSVEIFVHEVCVSSPIQYKQMEFLLWFSQNFEEMSPKSNISAETMYQFVAHRQTGIFFVTSHLP